MKKTRYLDIPNGEFWIIFSGGKPIGFTTEEQNWYATFHGSGWRDKDILKVKVIDQEWMSYEDDDPHG
jgi:hypothetical protein